MARLTSLQIGSGEPSGMYRRPPWVNVDMTRFAGRGHFVQASGAALPFRDGQFTRVHAIHVLEHLPRQFHVPMLREIGRVLADKGAGYAFIEVPDFLSVVRLLVDAAERGEQEECRIRTVGVYGKGRYPGDFHHWGFSPWYLEDRIREAGMRCRREYEMVSAHHKMEPVLLYRCWR